MESMIISKICKKSISLILLSLFRKMGETLGFGKIVGVANDPCYCVL